MRTACVVVTALSLLVIAQGRRGGGGRRGGSLGYSRAVVDRFSSSRSNYSNYGSSRRYNSSRVLITDKRIPGYSDRRSGVSDFLKNLVQGASSGLEQVGFKPDVATIRKNLMAYSKKIVGKAVARVDYEAKQIGSVFKDQAEKIADGYVGLVEQQAMREQAMLNKIENNYGGLTMKSLRSKVSPEVDRKLKQIPDKNLENIARSLIGSIDNAIDQQVPKELKSIPVSVFCKQLKDLEASQYVQQKKMLDDLKSDSDEVVDSVIVRPLSQATSVAIAPIAKQWMRKCKAMAAAEKKACMAKLTRVTAALKDQQTKSVMEAVTWYLAQSERAMEAANPSLLFG